MNVVAQYHELEQKIERLTNNQIFSKHKNMKLARMTCLLNLLGNPQKAFKIIHVGGTSGKSSTSHYIANILKNDGYKTGLFLSPYLQVLNEICLINGAPAKTSELLITYKEIEKKFLEVAAITKMGEPTYFEAKLALSLVLFKKKNIDVAVLEVGLGGKFDATNVVNSQVAVLVSVGLDHTEILGDTIEKIASDKVGIIKNQGMVICGFNQNSTQKIAIKRAFEQKATLFLLNQDFFYQYHQAKEELIITQKKIKYKFKIKLVSDYQAHNASCAILAYQKFQELTQKKSSLLAIEKGIRINNIPGRLEIVQNKPTVILDGAHNPDKLNSFFKKLQDFHTSPIIIFSLKKGREINSAIFPLLYKANPQKIITTSFAGKGIWQSLLAEELLKKIQKFSPKTKNKITTIAIPSPLKAIQNALKEANENDVIAVTGSFFLVGEIREYWHPKEKMLLCIENYD